MNRKIIIEEIITIINILLNKYKSEKNISVGMNDCSIEIAELGIDSLMYVRLIVKLEKKFNIDFLESDIIYNNLNTIDKITKVVELHLAGK